MGNFLNRFSRRALMARVSLQNYYRGSENLQMAHRQKKQWLCLGAPNMLTHLQRPVYKPLWIPSNRVKSPEIPLPPGCFLDGCGGRSSTNRKVNFTEHPGCL